VFADGRHVVFVAAQVELEFDVVEVGAVALKGEDGVHLCA